jgi:Glycosyl transferase family 2
VARDFTVVAIIAAFNEADIVEQVVRDLIAQGVDVYFLDDGSTDATVSLIEPYLDRGVLAIDRMAPAPGAAGAPQFEWERILRRKAELAAGLDADWFIHHDADELRESPWRELSLREAIRRVDALGYNAIDFASLDFRPVADTFRAGDDPRAAFEYYSVHAPHDRVQIRCWKRGEAPVDLASSGGHEAVFPGRRVFPVRFILRHYPIRSQEHGERKVFEERQRRYAAAERARGWHVQYEGMRRGDRFLGDAATLTRYDPDAVRLALTLRHRGVEELEQALADARSETAGVQALLDARERELGEVRDARAAGEHELQRVQAALAEAGGYCASLQSALAAAQAANADAGAHVAAVAAELTAHRDALDRRIAEIERWRESLESATRELEQLRGSWSWRLTAPARALLRLISGH